MVPFLLTLAAYADPWQDRWDRAWRVGIAGPVGTPLLLADWTRLPDEADPSLRLRLDAWERPFSAELGGWAALGTLERTDAEGLGDETITTRGRVQLTARTEWLDASASPTAGVSSAGSDARVHTWWLGLRRRHGYAGAGAVSLPTGPARHGPLISSRNALPPPGLGAGLRGRIAGSPHLAYTLDAHGGFLPGPRRDVTRPGWVLVDARTQLTRFVEIGATRASLFGGRDDEGPLPVDPLQVLLPTQPHVEGDPDRNEPDTDERAAWDVRLRIPLGAGIAAQGFVQHAGEDVILRDLGPLSWPTLAGVANAYGATLDVRDVWVSAEWAVVEDDRFRWYEGHRVYHEGWTRDGESLGHPRGGDQRSAWVQAGAAPDWGGGSLSFERVRRIEVLDVVGDTVFTLPQPETRTEVRASVLLFRAQGWWTLELGGAAVKHPDFSPYEQNRLEGSVALGFTTNPVTTDR